MIWLQTDLPSFFGDICEVIRLFLGPVDISLTQGSEVMTHTHGESGGVWTERFTFRGQEITHTAPAVYGGLAEKRFLKRAAKTACFLLMRDVTGIEPPWGSLTGIRPTRLMYELAEQGITGEAAINAMMGEFYVSRDKAALLSDILAMQQGLTDVPNDEFDLYIGIPFCVTRCAYCSFAAGEVGDGHLIEPYLAALKAEMAADAQLMDLLGLKMRAAYMGGGTPTSLTAMQLDDLLKTANRLFPGAREWTVEAGRPDTITPDRLQALTDNGVERISVNPQTFSDDTLRRIGRAHTAADTLAAFELARRMGFHHINMDLIAALPGEGESDFLSSLERCISLAPESITVHTLAIKRASRLHEQGYTQVSADAAAHMVHTARVRLGQAGWQPYYLYRQKYMAGNLENVGYAKPGYQCLYNIDNMEETTRILAEGAGSITKWLFPRERRIERAPNLRNIEQYITRQSEMNARKRALIMEE